MNRKQFMEQLERSAFRYFRGRETGSDWNIMKDILMMQVLRMKEK